MVREERCCGLLGDLGLALALVGVSLPSATPPVFERAFGFLPPALVSAGSGDGEGNESVSSCCCCCSAFLFESVRMTLSFL